MSEKPNKFYLTTPIYYVNARPHIGHAYTTIVADVLARRHRLLGDDTFFLTGTDEHGQKIERSAAAAGIAPQQFADDVSIQFRNLWDRMGLTYDRYIRTTDPKHQQGVQKLFSDLYAKGFIYLASYTGQYSIGEEMFVEGPPGTIGPDGKPTETVTEENFFFKLSEFQAPLINLIETGALKVEPEARKNEVLSFLRGNVNAATDFTTDTGIQSPESGGPSFASSAKGGVSGEARPLSSESAKNPENLRAYSDLGNAYVPGALKDLSISRSSFTWGIPVPEPAASAASQKHVIYVWLDALANYMTAIGYGSASPVDEAEFKKYWPADLHIIGKEISRFHCVYWPAFLLAAGLPLPKAITAHGWLLFDNSKMSKSKGNIVRTETILDAFGDEVYGKQFPDSTKAERDLFAADVLRYFLLREIPFGQDGSFSFDAMYERYNSDLTSGYGNLVSRTLTMLQSWANGEIPPKPLHRRENWEIIETLHSEQGVQALAAIDSLNFAKALDYIMMMTATTNGFLTGVAPWQIMNNALAPEEERLQVPDCLYLAADSIRVITAILYPILPAATAKVWLQLGLGDIEDSGRAGSLQNLKAGALEPGTKLSAMFHIFPRAYKGLTQIMTDMENPEAQSSKLEVESAPTRPESPLKSAATPTPATAVTNDPTHPAAPPRTSALEDPSASTHVAGSAAVTTERQGTPSHTEAPASGPFATVASQTAITAGPADASPQITIDDFVKIELRVAEIKVAERIPKADKLLRLEVDLGYERRQILSGIAEWYAPEDLIGRRIVVITNLAPRKMRGLESHGMLLAASHGENGRPVLATFSEDIALGSRLK